MTLGVICPRGKCSWDECHTCRMNPLHPCGYSPEMLQAMESDDEPPNTAFTPSRLLGCNRQTVLEEGEEKWIDVDKQWAFLRGTIIHSGLESLKVRSCSSTLRECRMTTTIETKYGPQEFSAKPDLVIITYQHQVPHITVIDYKTRDFGHELVSADVKHQLQVNMYAWAAQQLLNRNIRGPIRPCEVDGLEIQYISLSKTRRFVSQGPLTARGKKSFNKVEGKWEYETLELAPIKLLPMEQVGRLIRHLIERKIEARETLPPPLEGEAAKWCYRCPVYRKCRSLAERDAA